MSQRGIHRPRVCSGGQDAVGLVRLLRAGSGGTEQREGWGRYLGGGRVKGGTSLALWGEQREGVPNNSSSALGLLFCLKCPQH